MESTTVDGVLKKIEDAFGTVERVATDQSAFSAEIDDVYAACRFLIQELGGRLATISGVDTPESVEMLYHFAIDDQGQVVTLKTRAEKPHPQVRSIAGFLPGAEWIEREVHDLLGVEFSDHPNLKRLLLADDWPEGDYPLRKDQRQ